MSSSRPRRAIRWASFLIGLAAGVLFASIPPASADADQPQTYANRLMGFSISAPPDWRIGETGRRIPVVRLDPPGYTDLVSIQVSAHRHAGPDTIREWTDWQLSNYGRRFIVINEQSTISLGPGTTGFRTVFEWVGELNIKEEWTGVLHGRRGFIIRAFGTTTEFDRMRDTIDEIVRTFTVTAPDSTQASSDDVFVLLAEEPDSLDPALHPGAGARGMLNSLFGGLVRLDEDMQVIPDIARDWRISPDGTVYTFTLRYDAYFHNGDWVTTEDVLYSWERATDPKTGSPAARGYLADIVGVREKLAGETNKISGIEAVDLFTLRVTLKSPRRTFLHKLTHPVAAILDRDNVESGDIAERPLGTGPYRMIAWEKGRALILARNHRYHAKRPILYGIVHRFDDDDPIHLYTSKQIDSVAVPLAHIDRARNTRDDLFPDLVTSRSYCVHYLAFDTRTPPFDDLSVRRAFAQALDVDKLASVVMKGTVDPASTLTPPGILGHNANMNPYPFVPEAGRSLPTAAVERITALSPIPSAVDTPTMIWMWREHLGVDARPYTGPSADRAGVWTGTWCPDYLDPDNYLETFFHSDGVNNRSGYSNPEIDSMLEQAAQILDHDERARMYARIETIAREDWVVVPLWHERRYDLVQQHVANYTPSLSNLQFFRNIYFEQ